MSRKFFWVCAAVGILAGVARADEKADLKKENAELKRQNAELRKDVDKWRVDCQKLQDAWFKQEMELQAMRGRELPSIHFGPATQPFIVPAQPLTITPPSLQTLPPGTIEKHINGEPYYVIPISGDVSVGCTSVAVPTAPVGQEKK